MSCKYTKLEEWSLYLRMIFGRGESEMKGLLINTNHSAPKEAILSLSCTRYTSRSVELLLPNHKHSSTLILGKTLM